MIPRGGLLGLERDICIRSFQQGCGCSPPSNPRAPETQGQHSERPRKETQTSQTLHRQQNQSCTGGTPAGKAEGNASEKGQSTLPLPSAAVPQSSAG